MLIQYVKDQIAAGGFGVPDPQAAEKLASRQRWRSIVAEVADKYGMTPAELLAQDMRRKAARPRQEAMFRVRSETPLSLQEIGRRLGGRHHSTIIHGIRAHVSRMAAQ